MQNKLGYFDLKIKHNSCSTNLEEAEINMSLMSDDGRVHRRFTVSHEKEDRKSGR